MRTKKPVQTPDPQRYLSTNTNGEDGVCYFRVIGFGALPECRDTDSLEEAVAWFNNHRDMRAPITLRDEIPLWNGDAVVAGQTWRGAFTTLGAWEGAQ